MYEPLDTRIVEQTLDLMSFESIFHSERMKEFVEQAYRICVPIDFFIQPASSSGKYHPGYELGVGGLVRHTKAAMLVAKTLFPLYPFTEKEEDQIMAALALHDVAKPSKLHPVEVRPILEPIQDDYYEEVEGVVPLIESHMGQWDQFGKLPQPQSTTQKFVHLCDYLASRKYVSIDINHKEENT